MTTTWNFGDGAAADGAVVSHAYGAPGSFAPTVTATDALGNSTTSGGPVDVTAAAAPPPQRPHWR